MNTLILWISAGSEEMPVAVSHKNQGRIVYVYEPTLGTFVRMHFTPFCIIHFLFFLTVRIVCYPCFNIMFKHIRINQNLLISGINYCASNWPVCNENLYFL